MPVPPLPRGGWTPGRSWTLSMVQVMWVAAALVLAIVAALAWWGWTRARPVPATSIVSVGLPIASASSMGASPPASGRPADVVVHVLGLVRRPGVVRLASGSRVADAITAAGGLSRGVTTVTVNLARKLVDGEQVVVGTAPPVPTTEGGGDPVGPLDLNTATVDQLDALPGVGPVMAQRIIDWRTEHGGFSSVDQLREVSGVGDKKFADLAPRVRV